MGYFVFNQMRVEYTTKRNEVLWLKLNVVLDLF